MTFRNIAIIAHVDHGKTTLVDAMLKASQIFRDGQEVASCVLDSYDLERERGITILAKNTAVNWGGTKINIVDTPGHADFGGEVERALQMVDGVLLLVDAAEGPMPQTRFVLKKALARGLKPILVVNKVDRKDARPDQVVDLTFDMMVELGASDDQLDFPVLYAIAREGRTWSDLEAPGVDLTPLFRAIVDLIPPAGTDAAGPFQFQVANLDYSDYLGRIAIGRVMRGTARQGDTTLRLAAGGVEQRARVGKLYTHLGLERVEAAEVGAGDIVAITGIDGIQIGDTLTDPDKPEGLAVTAVDAPTVSVVFSPNTSPFAGQDGSFLTSRHIAARLERELLTNVALRVEPLTTERYRVSGRGELHLSILIEQMRREGYEFSVSRPEVIFKTDGDVLHEPFERVVADVPDDVLGAVMESLASRRGKLLDLKQGEDGRARLEFSIPSRSLFGYRTHFLSITQGDGLLHHVFDGYESFAGEVRGRSSGSLVAVEAGEAFAYSLFKLQDRGVFFVPPGTPVYTGMIVGANNRPGDLNVNVCKNKKLTNVRAATSDDNLTLAPPRRLSLEEALEYLAEDELLEVTPKQVRLRKRVLDPKARKRSADAAPA